MKHLYSILLFCLGCCIKVSGAVDTTHLMHFDLNTGFPTNNVYSLIQDHNGYLWFATDNGVVKYNGYSFKVFNTNTGLPSNDVYQLYEDKRGRIWILSLTYQFGYIENDAYYPIRLTANDRVIHVTQVGGNDSFVFFTFHQHSSFWLGVVKQDLIGAYPVYGTTNWQLHDTLHISSALLAPDNKLWVYGRDHWYTYDLIRPDKALVKRCFAVKPFPLSYPSTLLANSNGNIIEYGNKDSVVHTINTRTCIEEVISFEKEKGENIYNFEAEHPLGSAKKVSYLMTNSALYTLDTGYHILAREKFETILPVPAQIAYVFDDNYGDRWYTTNGAGTWCRFKRFYDSFAISRDLAELGETKFVGASGGASYWWSSSRKALYSLGVHRKLKTEAFSGNSNFKSIASLKDSTVFVSMATGTFRHGKSKGRLINLVDEKRKILYYIIGSPEPVIVNSPVLSTTYLSNHTLADMNDSTLFSISKYGLSIWHFKRDSLVIKQLNDERYNGIFIDNFYGKVWAFNSRKLTIYDNATDKQLDIQPDYLNSLGIQNIQNIETDSFANVYVLNNDKLLIFNPGVMRTSILRGSCMLQNSFFHIRGKRIFVAGGFGLAVAEITGPLSMGEFKVIPNINYNNYNRIFNFVVNQDDHIVLNTDKGVYELDLKDLESKQLFLPAKSDFFKIVMKYPYSRRLLNNDTLSISQKNEKIILDAINYYGRGAPVFKYFIEGYTKDWQQSDGDIVLSSFAPGVLYKVQCVASDEMWRSKLITFYVYRLPYWWQTQKWAVVFWILGITAVVILLLLVVLTTRAVVARSNEKKRVLLELELKALYAQINPHFIFNTLSTAQFFISKKRFDDAYIHVNKFSRLLRGYLKSSQDRYITLDEEVNMLRNYIELQQIRFEDKFSYSIEIDNKIPAMNLLIPSLLIQPLVENAISHGLFHRQSGGLLTIRFLQGNIDGELICIIEDNGIGRYKARELNKLDTTRRESYGTKLTEQLINIYKEYEHVDINLEYVDKSGAETGTIVKLIISKTKFIA
ncbi:MAG: histidine kinase [Bacteroidetes bacterium]|nr:histidine kinase [Bacteroidota bacterium]